MNYWDKLTGEIQKRVSKAKDEAANALLRRLIMVPPRIKEAMLKGYVDKCRQMHAIAFLQWRAMYPTPSYYHNMDELNEIIESRI